MVRPARFITPNMRSFKAVPRVSPPEERLLLHAAVDRSVVGMDRFTYPIGNLIHNYIAVYPTRAGSHGLPAACPEMHKNKNIGLGRASAEVKKAAPSKQEEMAYRLLAVR